MNLRRLYILLSVWAFLLIAPSVLVRLAVLWHLDVDYKIGDALIASWVVAWLAQFGVFMWTMNTFKFQGPLWRTLSWWFTGSLLAWGLDWTPPSLLLWLQYAAALAVPFWIGWAARQSKLFTQRAIQATGIVLEVREPMMNVVINNVYIKRKVRLKVEREDGAPEYEAVLDGLYMLGEIPSPGDRMPLVVDPENPQHVEYRERADSNSSSPSVPSHHLRTASAASAPAQSHRSEVTDELERLVRLKDRGALDESEFRDAKRKLLGE